MLKKIWIAAALSTSLFSASATADVGDDVSQAARSTKKSARKATRAAKDETCELVNGKMECAGKKMKHKAQNAADDAKDAVKKE